MARVQIPEAFRDLWTPSRYKAYFGGRGSAKSRSVATALVVKAAQSPQRIICAREIQKSLRDSSYQLIVDSIAQCGLESAFEVLDTEVRGRNGSRFIFMGMWRNPEAIKSLEGADVFWADEASALSERSLKIIRPTMRKPGSELWFTWNPEFDSDPIDKFFRAGEAPPDSIVREVSWRDNPWFGETPLKEELDFDYRADPAKAEHVWGGAYVTVIDGAYYASDLRLARDEGRIGIVAADPILSRRAYWDIGVRDSTAIWIAQFVGREIRVLDYIEGQGQPLAYYLAELRSRGHSDAECVLPHDGAQREKLHAERYETHVEAGGFKTRIVKNQGKGAAKARIEAARRIFNRIWFNEETTRGGLKALAAYHERKDEKRLIGLGPEHDWASDGADAFGLMCVDYEEPRTGPRESLAPKRSFSLTSGGQGWLGS